MRFEKQIALINGAASGIGESAAKSLAREGCTVVLTDIQEEPLKKVTESLNRAGLKAVGYKMDVTKADEIDAVVSRVIEQFGASILWCSVQVFIRIVRFWRCRRSSLMLRSESI